MGKLSSMGFGPARELAGNVNYSRGVFAIGVTTTAVTSTNAFNYTINGVYYNRAALTNAAITDATGPLLRGLVTTYQQPAGTTVYYVLALNSAGVLKVVQGSFAGQDLGSAVVGTGQIPDIASDLCPVGVMKIVNVTNPFIIGTTALNAAGVTATFFDVAVLPAGVL